MALVPSKRRWSIELPPHMSELMNRLIEYANSFIREFDNKQPKMRKIVRKFQEIVDEVKEMQEGTDTVRRAAGGLTAGAEIGIFGFGLLAAPFTGGASLALAASAGAATAAAGGAVVVRTNITKMMKEKGTVSTVENLGKEFMEIIEPLKKNLKEIKTTCEKLEERSAEVQAEKTLTDVEEFQRILRRVSELRRKSEGAIDVTVSVLGFIGNLLVLLVNVIRVSPTPEQDQRFRDAIIQSGDQCQRVVDQFDHMKEKLKDFTGN